MLVVVGTVIQMRMTWSREHMRSITSEASDIMAAAKEGAEYVTPEEHPFAPFLEVLNAVNEEPIAQ